MSLSFKAVHIQCLDEEKKPIKNANATGFIVQEKEGYFLYTCWHVVTGYNMHNVSVGHNLPNRKFLKVDLQGCERPQPGVEAIGGNQDAIISLYNNTGHPAWIQNKQDVENTDLNSINIKVPFWHDAVKLPLKSDISVSDMQLLNMRKSVTTLPLSEKNF